MTEEAGETIDAPKPEPGPDGFLAALAIMLAVCVVAEISYRESVLDLRLRQGANYVTCKSLDYAALGGDIVTHGDSRMFHAINPSVMHQSLWALKGRAYTTYNFGIPSGTMPIALMVAHEAARHKPPPKVFVMGVSPNSFSCCDTVSVASVQNGVRWGAVPSFLKAGWYASTEDALSTPFYGASRLLAFRSELITAVHDITLPPVITFPDRGFVSLGGPVAPATQDVRAKGRAVPYADLMDKSKGATLHAFPCKLLDQAVTELQRAGVNVVIMATPQAGQLEWYLDEKHVYFEYLAEVQRIADKHHVPFVDMHRPRGIDDTDFMDGDHLSEAGGVKFTRLVAAEIVAPLLP
jgi:hypothetical protein